MFGYINSDIFEVFLVWCFIFQISYSVLSFFIEQKLIPNQPQELTLSLGIRYFI